MTLHCVAIYDDDPTSTAANIASADFIDGESIVQTRDGQVPILRGINGVIAELTGVNSVVYQTSGFPRITMQPSTWKETNKIFWEDFVQATPYQDGTTAADFNNALTQRINLEAWGTHPYDIQLTENMNWINAGDTQWIGFNATAQMMLVMLSYQYGPAIPWNGNMHPTVVVRKSAGADATADVWSEVANELFTDDGLDPDAVYRPLWGYCAPEAALDKVCIGWRMTSTDAKTWIGGCGPGSDYGSHVRTWFINDSMLINGDSQIKFEALCDQAMKADVVVAFQEVKKGAEPRAGGGAPARARGPVSGRSLRMPGLGARLGVRG